MLRSRIVRLLLRSMPAIGALIAIVLGTPAVLASTQAHAGSSAAVAAAHPAARATARAACNSTVSWFSRKVHTCVTHRKYITVHGAKGQKGWALGLKPPKGIKFKRYNVERVRVCTSKDCSWTMWTNLSPATHARAQTIGHVLARHRCKHKEQRVGGYGCKRIVNTYYEDKDSVEYEYGHARGMPHLRHVGYINVYRVQYCDNPIKDCTWSEWGVY